MRRRDGTIRRAVYRPDARDSRSVCLQITCGHLELEVILDPSDVGTLLCAAPTDVDCTVLMEEEDE